MALHFVIVFYGIVLPFWTRMMFSRGHRYKFIRSCSSSTVTFLEISGILNYMMAITVEYGAFSKAFSSARKRP